MWQILLQSLPLWLEVMVGRQHRGKMILLTAWQGCSWGRPLKRYVLERSDFVEGPEENDTGDQRMQGCMQVKDLYLVMSASN